MISLLIRAHLLHILDNETTACNASTTGKSLLVYYIPFLYGSQESKIPKREFSIPQIHTPLVSTF